MDTTHEAASGDLRTADHPTVLVIDDDPAVRDGLARVFDDAGMLCRGAGSIDHARGVALDVIHLVILDLSLGGGDAVDVLDHLADQDYAGAVVLITGFDTGVLEPVQRLGAMIGLTMWPYLTKPLRPTSLKQLVERLSGGPVRLR